MTSSVLTRRFVTWILILTGGGLAGTSHAAEVNSYDDPAMSCYLRLDGPLETGDAAALGNLLEHFASNTDRRDYPSSPRICLNSEGGEYAAAIEIIEQLGGQFSTAVAANDTCAGPCALVFMAGREGAGGTLDSNHGGRIVHPKGTLRFGEAHTPQLNIGQVRRLLELQTSLDLHGDVIAAMIEDTPVPRTLYTVGEAALWQIRIGPSVMPDRLSPLAVLNACTNSSTPLIDRLRFADEDFHTPDWPERQTPKLSTSGSGTQYGELAIKLNRLNSECDVSFGGANSLPTGPIGTARFALGGGDGDELYRPLYGAMMFTSSTPLRTLARKSDVTPQKISVAALSAPDRSDDNGLCGVVSNGALTTHFRCARTISVAPDDALNSMTRTTFDNGNGVLITATATGEYGRSWPQDMEPEYTFERANAEYWRDGMPDEGEDGNDPGADTACRIVTDGQSQWCPTSFWRHMGTGDMFLFIADKDVEAGLEYAGWD
ncbi:hypothetical protein [Roseovarius pelagicus]|uniref:Uncharacterized protein n=1 Tax=Roseovarius pelagicus TaxID=2980108 RepID=A0ABY6D9X2_9RHOB|nr:hypothetical protein [Roseovarius pelagicus]UXX81853.1 hypothetical protein N7U68_12030 [Roseovarius pelagicus]